MQFFIGQSALATLLLSLNFLQSFRKILWPVFHFLPIFALVVVVVVVVAFVVTGVGAWILRRVVKCRHSLEEIAAIWRATSASTACCTGDVWECGVRLLIQSAMEYKSGVDPSSVNSEKSSSSSKMLSCMSINYLHYKRSTRPPHMSCQREWKTKTRKQIENGTFEIRTFECTSQKL